MKRVAKKVFGLVLALVLGLAMPIAAEELPEPTIIPEITIRPRGNYQDENLAITLSNVYSRFVSLGEGDTFLTNMSGTVSFNQDVEVTFAWSVERILGAGATVESIQETRLVRANEIVNMANESARRTNIEFRISLPNYQWFDDWNGIYVTEPLSIVQIDQQQLREQEGWESFIWAMQLELSGLAISGEEEISLPEPEPEIPEPEPIITPPADGVTVIFNSSPLAFDVPPQIINNRTMVPLRAIFEAMGAYVEWDGDTQTATATRGDTVVILPVGSYSPTVNGTVVPIDQPGVIVDNRTLAPLRFVAEAFGGTVEWDNDTQTATIVSN